MRRFLFTNGPIYPMDGPPFPAGAVVTAGPRIEYVGRAADLSIIDRADLEEIDLDGRPLFPGFCDAHVHLVMSSDVRRGLSCRGVRSFPELQNQLRTHAHRFPRDTWLTGFGWEKKRLFSNGPPTIDLLDEVVPDRPVFLVSNDAHSAWLNSIALKQLARHSNRSAKWQIDHQSGLVYEDVLDLRRDIMPASTIEQKQHGLSQFIERLHSFGITAVHNNETWAEIDWVRSYLTTAEKRVRVFWNPVFRSPDALTDHMSIFQQRLPNWLGLGGAKVFLDGSLGSLTAAVGQPYRGTQNDLGILNLDRPELLSWLRAIRAAHTYGVFHTIGDRATEQLLECLAEIEWSPSTRHRLEHVQLLSERIIQQHDFSKLVFSVQPSHLWGDRSIVEQHLDSNTRDRYAYLYQTMQQKGGLVVFGSDSPVEDVNPWLGIQAAVTRLENSEHSAWNPAEALSLFEAIRAHTANPRAVHGGAFPAGVLRVGDKADLVVFNRDPFSSVKQEPADVAYDRIQADLTMLDGEIVFSR